jgi:hypothetical protein
MKANSQANLRALSDQDADMDAYTSDPQTRKRKIECKPELVIASLQRFYANHPEIEKVLTYLNGEAPLSLRIIDWFVTKYSRKNFVRYPLNGHDFLVYLSYKGQLKAYSKQYFDPNCRRERIMFKIPNHETFMTTIGKLNFFRWALESNILEYMEAHEDDIRKGYNSYLKETVETQKRNKSEANLSAKSTTSIASEASVEGQPILNINVARTTRRRTKQSPSSLNKLQVYNTPVVLDFN